MSPATNIHLRHRLLIALALATGAVAVSAAADRGPGARAAAGVSVTATALPEDVTLGGSVTVSGHLSGEPAESAGRALQLEAEPYPFRAFAVIARTQSAADGSFTFAPDRPELNSRLRVLAAGSPGVLSPALTVTVDPQVRIQARSLGPGREDLSIRIVHTGTAPSGSTSVFWYLAGRGSPVFKLAKETPSLEIAPGVTFASAIVDPPAHLFAYRVCLNPGWEAAMGPPATHGPCPDHDFRLPGGH